MFAAEEFFYGRIRNEHTRAAYLIAVKRFLEWAEKRGLELVRISPKDVGNYLDGLKKQNTSVATRKQHLAALRHFFDGLVTRHAIILNPALSVRGERYEVVEGKTPEITVKGARTLLASMKADNVVGLRDRAIIALLIYTAARAGAVAALRRGSLYESGDQWMLHFDEKGGKSREIPVRHDWPRCCSNISTRPVCATSPSRLPSSGPPTAIPGGLPKPSCPAWTSAAWSSAGSKTPGCRPAFSALVPGDYDYGSTRTGRAA